LHLFSPYKLVIEIHSASDLPNKCLNLNACARLVAPTSNNEIESVDQKRKDHIEQKFGDREESYIRSIRDPSGPPKRSRDDSIKLLYSVQAPSDWLDLVEGHDDHVSFS
jgi:hypothetical protein